MWNRPQLLKDVADLLYLAGAAALAVAAALWVARLPLFPIREVVVMNALREVHRVEIEESLAGKLRGNFFSINLESLRQSLEQIPRVRHVTVRRQWPANIELSIEEHVPVAFWGDGSGHLVNSFGEIFTAGISVPPAHAMPVLQGPTGFIPEMLDVYRQAVTVLEPLGRLPRILTVSPRLAVQLKLDDGMIVELGRQQTKAPLRERLERFVEFYPTVLTAAKKRPEVVDMRYPKGFALRVAGLAAAPESEGKGKP